MSLPKDRIAYLIEVYTSKKATAEEEQELMEWLQDAKEDSELKAYVQSLWKKCNSDIKHDYVNWDNMFQRIVEGGKVLTIAPQRKLLPWVSVAAAILLLIGASYFFIFRPSQNNEIATTTTPQIIQDVSPPKKTKAMITLANGQQIALGSVANGSLALQGNIKIVKLADGKIAYQTASGEVLKEMQYNTLFNPQGSKVIDMKLSDGSRVWLNAGSSITYPVAFLEKERKVKMTGEGYFEVAHDETKPFYVSTGETEVRVLGTHFNVKAYDNDVTTKVTLLEGGVNVSKNANSQILVPGQQAQITTNGQIALNKNVDVEEVMAWKNGEFLIQSADIKTVMRELVRWYDIDVEYRGDIKEKFRFRIARNTNVSNVFKILETTGAVHFKIEGKKITVMP